MWLVLGVMVVIAVGLAINRFGWQQTGWLDDVLGTADPATYTLEQTACEARFGDYVAEGTLRNDTDSARTFALRVRFFRGGRIAGAGFVLGSDVRSGHDAEWTVSDSNPGGPPNGKLGCQVLVDEFP